MLRKIGLVLTGLFTSFCAFCGVRAMTSRDHPQNYTGVVSDEVYKKASTYVDEIDFASNGQISLINFSSTGSASSVNIQVYYQYDGAFEEVYLLGYDVRWTGSLAVQYRNQSDDLLAFYGVNIPLTSLNRIRTTLRCSCSQEGNLYRWTIIPIFYYSTLLDDTFQEFTITDMQYNNTSSIGTSLNGLMVASDNFNMQYLNYIIGYNSNVYQDYYNNGYSVGLSDGYDNGYSVGYSAGYYEGYRIGNLDASNTTINFLGLFGAIADTPVLIIRNLLGFDIFGTSALTIFMSLLTACVVIHFIRKFI